MAISLPKTIHALTNYSKTGLERKDFEFFRAAIQSRTGINLSERKIDLLQTRLLARIRALGLETFRAYRNILEKAPDDSPEWQELVNLVTTNKTDWFREAAHFDFLVKTYLPSWNKIGKKKLKAWCAACSTGEEPYSLAAVLKSALDEERDFVVCASDIDTRALAIAENGVYSRSRIRQISYVRQEDLFAFGSGDISEWMKVRDKVRAHVNFFQLNLTEVPYGRMEDFDIIFCRNVFIYFQKPTIEKIVNDLYKTASSGAVLVIGHSESLHGIKHEWRMETPSVYRK